MNAKNIRRGEIYYANLDPVIGSEQGGIRPVLIIQNNIGNRFSPTTIIVAITSKGKVKHRLPTHFDIPFGTAGLDEDSTILAEQIRTIDKIRFQRYVGRLSDEMMARIDRALKISIGLEVSYIPQSHVG
jgi:mRNA interferase MazF